MIAPEDINLAIGEPHPSAVSALRYIRSLRPVEIASWRESFASCALSGNRPAAIMSETLRRVLAGEPVSDRYLLGLAWFIRDASGS